MTDPGIPKPVLWKLIGAIIAIFAFKDSPFKHLPRREIWPELRREALAGQRNNLVPVVSLHAIIHDNHIAIAVHTPCPFTGINFEIGP